MKRKFLAALLALVMVFSMIPVSASANLSAEMPDSYLSLSYNSEAGTPGSGELKNVRVIAIDSSTGNTLEDKIWENIWSTNNQITINLTSSASNKYDIESVSISKGAHTEEDLNSDSFSFRWTYSMYEDEQAVFIVYVCPQFEAPTIIGGEVSGTTIRYIAEEPDLLKLVHMNEGKVNSTTTIDAVSMHFVEPVNQTDMGADWPMTDVPTGADNLSYFYASVTADWVDDRVQPGNIRYLEISYTTDSEKNTVRVYSGDLRYVVNENIYYIQSDDDSQYIVTFYNHEGASLHEWTLYDVQFVAPGTSIGTENMPANPTYPESSHYYFTNWTDGPNGGNTFLANTVINDDTVVYAQKHTTTSAPSEIHVINYEGELVNRFVELYNANHPDSPITANDIAMDTVKISVFGIDGSGEEYYTNPNYSTAGGPGGLKNRWINDDEYYFVYNYLSGAGSAQNDQITNTNEITKFEMSASSTTGESLGRITVNRGTDAGDFEITMGGGSSNYAIEIRINKTPTAPTDKDLLDDPNDENDPAILGENVVKVTCTNMESGHTPAIYGLLANTNGQNDSYTIGAVTALAGGGYTCTITVHNGPYVAEYGENHTLSTNEPESQDIVLTWDSDSNTWNAPSTLPVNFNVICDTEPGGGEEPSVPGIDDVEQALEGNIEVACSTNTEHEMQNYGYVDGAISYLDSAKVEQDADGSYICKLTLDTGKYVGRYNEYHSGHTLVDPSTPVIITLHYTKKDGTGTWYMEAPVIIEVECNSGTTDPEKPDEGTVTGLLGNEAVLVQCDVADSGHARRYYPLLSGTFTIGDVENNTVKVTVDSNEYLKEYTLYSGKEHSEVIAQDENYFTLTWNGKDWTVSGNPVTFTVHCSTTEEPEEPTAPDVENILGPNAVEVLCVTNNGIHGSKTYGLLNGGYMEQGPDWITGQGEEDGYWQYVVTIDAGVYQAQFNTDTKSKHDLASPAETYLPITLIYRDNTWVIEGTEPYTTIKLVCDSKEPTLPEKPDDETIYDIFNGNKPVILACVTENSGHEEQAFDLLTNSYDIGEVKEIDGRYLCDITIVNVQDYIDIYNENTDKEHSLSPNQPDQVLTLKYVNGEWAIDDDGIVRYTVACEDTSTEPTPDPDPTPDPTPTPGPGGGDKPPYIPPVDPDDSGVSDLLNTDDHIQYLFGYPEGTFGPENNMTRAEVAQMFYNLLLDQDVTITKTFDDVPANAWYAKAVNTLASLGVVSGVGNGDFEPERSITRAEFTSIAMKFAEGKTGGTNIFSDVKSTDWFYRAVVNSTQYGWIHGYGDGTFRPNNPITRVEVTAIVNNMLGREADVDFVTEHYDELNHFSDLAVSHWGYYHIVEATNDHDYTKPSSGENWTELN